MARKELRLKDLLQTLGIRQSALARVLQVSPATITQLLAHSIFPKHRSVKQLRELATPLLRSHGATEEQISTAFESQEWTPERDGARESDVPTTSEEDEVMLMRKQVLTPAAYRHFKLFRDPFAEVGDTSEFYADEEIRYARLAMADAALNCGFMALIGESGAGKSTLRRDLIDQLNRKGPPIRVIQPYVITMGETAYKGTPLKAASILESILTNVAPSERPKMSYEARMHQVHKALIDSHHAGNKHVIIIEEAHSMPTPTLNALKRVLEMEVDGGHKRLAAIILVAHPELAERLSVSNRSVREVAQRCQFVTLPPLSNVGEYLKFRFKRLDVDVSKVISTDGIEALCDRLQPRAPRGHVTRSFLYPLAVHNLLAASMNLAAEAGAPVVNGDIVREV